MLLDKTGYEVKIGQLVDTYCSGMLTCSVVEIREGGIADANGKTPEPVLVLNVIVPIRINPGVPCPVYVVREPLAPEIKTEERIM